MLPRAVDKFPNFDWTTIEWKKDVSLRNLEKRDDLGFYSPDTQYFYEECIVTKKIKGVTTRVFKKPTKLSQVGWVFSPSLVEELNNSETEREAHAIHATIDDTSRRSHPKFQDFTHNTKTSKQSATGGVWKSPDHRALRDTLGKGGMNLPAEELMTKLDTNVLLNVKFFPVLKLGLTEAMAGPKKFEIQDSQ
ncbi:hypothetical protein C8J56DRAFT_903773 [Mycena floridula]|nr:hypothetical protein C8J56DRAFT_903773 [Mycena floridula]